MILSASRRTDIPAFYTDWFMNRIRGGSVSVRNPMNHHQVSRVSLSPDAVDCIVFWTKNAEPMIGYLEELARYYPFFFQYTLNGYGRDIEPFLPPMEQKLAVFIRLSSMIGIDWFIWRYDPVLLTETYSISWHIGCFAETAAQLKGFTNTCVFSYLDLYDKIKGTAAKCGIRTCDTDEMNVLAKAFSEIACKNGMTLQTCAEAVDLDRYGIRHGSCVDGALIEKITGCRLKAGKDRNRCEECCCIESVDIGQYNTCGHGCRYCYANFDPQNAAAAVRLHDPASPFLTGGPEPNDRVTDRDMRSLLIGIKGQTRLLPEDE